MLSETRCIRTFNNFLWLEREVFTKTQEFRSWSGYFKEFGFSKLVGYFGNESVCQR